MANINLTSGFKICPEGRHIFRIYRVDYDPAFGKVVVYMVNAKGQTHLEKFNLMNNNGEMNEKACNVFSFFAKTALNNFKLESIDHTALINCYIGCEIVHNSSPSRTEPGQTVTFANSTEKWVADGFDTEPCEKALTLGTNPAPAETAKPAQSNGVDLNSLLS